MIMSMVYVLMTSQFLLVGLATAAGAVIVHPGAKLDVF